MSVIPQWDKSSVDTDFVDFKAFWRQKKQNRCRIQINSG